MVISYNLGQFSPIEKFYLGDKSSGKGGTSLHFSFSYLEHGVSLLITGNSKTYKSHQKSGVTTTQILRLDTD